MCRYPFFWKIILTFLILILYATHNGAFAQSNLRIVTTIKPVYSLVKNVVGDDADVTLLVDGNNSPHHFQLKPSQMRELHNADIIFYIDKNFETFLPKVLSAINTDITKIGLANIGVITLLEQRRHDNWEKHNHDKHDHDKITDYHIWLSPDNAMILTNKIAYHLGKLKPDLKETFEQNAQKTIDKIKRLDQTLRTQLKDVKNIPFIVFHDAYQYFEKAYDLNAVGSVTINPELLSKPSNIIHIKNKIKELSPVCVFSEPQFSNRLVNTAVYGTSVKLAMLDPLGSSLEKSQTAYFEMMENLGQSFYDCLNVN